LTLFWIAVFLLVAFVLLLAIYDLVQIRRDHRVRLNHLEQELADAAEEARQLAEELKKAESETRDDTPS
jgi:predicted Holliday junction resolvase-like endonuclease